MWSMFCAIKITSLYQKNSKVKQNLCCSVVINTNVEFQSDIFVVVPLGFVSDLQRFCVWQQVFFLEVCHDDQLLWLTKMIIILTVKYYHYKVTIVRAVLVLIDRRFRSKNISHCQRNCVLWFRDPEWPLTRRFGRCWKLLLVFSIVFILRIVLNRPYNISYNK